MSEDKKEVKCKNCGCQAHCGISCPECWECSDCDCEYCENWVPDAKD